MSQRVYRCQNPDCGAIYNMQDTILYAGICPKCSILEGDMVVHDILLDPNTIRAPFTVDEVMALLEYQTDDKDHPYTCPNKDKDHNVGEGGGILMPSVRGWICLFCDYTQNLAHNVKAE